MEGCRRQEKRYDPSTIDQLGAVDRGFSWQLESNKMLKVINLPLLLKKFLNFFFFRFSF